MHRTILQFAFAVALSLNVTAAEASCRALDGDTYICRNERIRLENANAPELHARCSAELEAARAARALAQTALDGECKNQIEDDRPWPIFHTSRGSKFKVERTCGMPPRYLRLETQANFGGDTENEDKIRMQALLRRQGYDFLALGFGLAPIVAVVAPNGLAVVFVVLGVVGLVAAPFSAPRTIWAPIAALVLWAAVTVIWSPAPRQALDGLVRIATASVLGLALVSALSQAAPAHRERIEDALMLGGLVAGALLAVQLMAQLVRSDQAGIAGYFLPPHTNFQAFFNRTIAFMSLLLPIGVFIVWKRLGMAAAAWTSLAGVTLVFAFNSKAAELAVVVACVGVLFASIFGGAGRRWLAGFLAALFMAAPWIAQSEAIRQLAERRDISPSIYHRAAIWEFVASRIDQAPVFGWGLHASRQMPGARSEIAPGAELLPLHPHNAALQIWLELGLVGAAIAAGLIWMIAIRIPDSQGSAKAATATLLAAMATASVGYGLWQGWWMGSLWLVAGLCALEFRADGTRLSSVQISSPPTWGNLR